jgi:phage terminase Nu1 subunit (DNA packaging protein)
MAGAQTYPVETVARLLDLSPRRVQQLSNEGVIPKAERGRYELVPAVQGYIRYLKSKAIAADTGSDDSEHKKRLTKARADIAEMEAERLSGNLVDVGAVAKTWSSLFTFARTKFLTLPDECAELVSVDETIEGCHEIIETHVHKILAELAAAAVDSDGEAATSGEPGAEEPSPAAEADDLGMGGSLSEAE